jgi:hypothetical protein
LRSLFGATANRSSQCLACQLRSPDPNPTRTPIRLHLQLTNPYHPPIIRGRCTANPRAGLGGLTRSLRGVSSNPPSRTRSKNRVPKIESFFFLFFEYIVAAAPSHWRRRTRRRRRGRSLRDWSFSWQLLPRYARGRGREICADLQRRFELRSAFLSRVIGLFRSFFPPPWTGGGEQGRVQEFEAPPLRY